MNKKPKAKLIGADGNVFNLLAIASRALEQAGLKDEAQIMRKKVFASKSYDEALQIMMIFVDAE